MCDGVTKNDDKIAICSSCLNQGIQRFDENQKLYWCVMCGHYQGDWKEVPQPRSEAIRKVW